MFLINKQKRARNQSPRNHQGFLYLYMLFFNFFNSEVDENPDYDNLDIVNRDAEDKYFDEDDEEEDEEEEEENMTE